MELRNDYTIKMEHFKIGQWTEAATAFEILLPGIPLKKIISMQITCINGYISIDLFKLEELIKKRYPNEIENTSMKGIIIKHYGQNASDLIEAVI